MSDSSKPGKLVRLLAGSPGRALATCVCLAALALLAYQLLVAGGESPAVEPRARLTPGRMKSPREVPDKYTIGATRVKVHPMGVFSEHTAGPTPFPIQKAAGRREDVPRWWEKPRALTEKEIGYQRYLSSITWRLPPRRLDKIWDVGGDQRGLQTIRFYTGFVGYAAAALGMRTPAYLGATSRIMLAAIERLIDRRAWSFVSLLWSDKPWYPDPAAHENVQYTGHLIQLMAMYEAMTGDDRFRTRGFDLVWDQDTSFHYTLMSLVDVTVKQMRENPSGGVACEPRHVFFICNNHPHVGLKLLSRMGLGDWSDVHRKWESFILDSCYDDLGGGAIKGVYHQDKKKFFPIGYSGTDGWGLMWYSVWASDVEVPRAIWKIARKRITGDLFAPKQNVRREKPRLQDTGDLVSYLTAILKSTLPAIPSATHLYPAASACGDEESAARLREMIERRFLTQAGGMYFLKVHHRFNIGANANMALGLALENGSNVRHLVQRPLPRDYFEGPLIEEVRPDSTAVFQAYREQDDLVVELESGEPVELVLRNAPAVDRVEGVAADAWSFGDGVLRLDGDGRRTIRIVTAGK